MELALEFGCTVESLKRTLSERELWQWARYRAQHQLPSRRLELMIAQLTAWVVRLGSGGGAGKNANIQDFMLEMQSPFEEPGKAAPEDADVEALRTVFSFAPRKRKGS